MVFFQDLEAVACPLGDRAFNCFWLEGAPGKLPGGFKSLWLGSGGSLWGFPLAAGWQGRQEEEGGWSPAVARCPAVKPFQGLSYPEVGDPGSLRSPGPHCVLGGS